jgi:hypothetical protein
MGERPCHWLHANILFPFDLFPKRCFAAPHSTFTSPSRSILTTLYNISTTFDWTTSAARCRKDTMTASKCRIYSPPCPTNLILSALILKDLSSPYIHTHVSLLLSHLLPLCKTLAPQSFQDLHPTTLVCTSSFNLHSFHHHTRDTHRTSKMFALKTLAALLAATLVSADVPDDGKVNASASAVLSATAAIVASQMASPAGLIGNKPASTISINIGTKAWPSNPTAIPSYGGEDDGGDDDDEGGDDDDEGDDDHKWGGKHGKNVTSTIFSTTIYTVTSCASTVPTCPGKIGKLTTEIITLTTTFCPASTPPPPPPPTTTPCPPTTTPAQVASTSCLTTSYYPAPGNSTVPSKPTGTKPAYPTFSGAAQKVGGSLSLVAVLGFVIAAL